MDVSELPAMWREWGVYSSTPAALAAANAMAETHARMARALVSGPSPGAPGAPPGLVSGNLRDNIRALPAVGGGGRAVAKVGSFAIYAGVQEWGATLWPNNGRFLRFIGREGYYVYARSVTVKPHPYMSTATKKEVVSGAFTNVARRAFWAVMVKLV